MKGMCLRIRWYFNITRAGLNWQQMLTLKVYLGGLEFHKFSEVFLCEKLVLNNEKCTPIVFVKLLGCTSKPPIKCVLQVLFRILTFAEKLIQHIKEFFLDIWECNIKKPHYLFG